MGWHGTHMARWLEGRGEKQNQPEPPVNALLLFVFYLKKWLEFILLPGKAASLYDDKIAEFTRKFIYIGFERQTLQWQTPAKTWACWLSHFPWLFYRHINPLLWQVPTKRGIKSKHMYKILLPRETGYLWVFELKIQTWKNKLADVGCWCYGPTPHIYKDSRHDLTGRDALRVATSYHGSHLWDNWCYEKYSTLSPLTLL